MTTLAHRVIVIHSAKMGWPQAPIFQHHLALQVKKESLLCAPHPANGVQSVHFRSAKDTLWVRHSSASLIERFFPLAPTRRSYFYRLVLRTFLPWLLRSKKLEPAHVTGPCNYLCKVMYSEFVRIPKMLDYPCWCISWIHHLKPPLPFPLSLFHLLFATQFPDYQKTTPKNQDVHGETLTNY